MNQIRSYDGAMVSSKGKQNESGESLGNMTDECRHVGNHVSELPKDPKVVGKPPKGEGQRHRSQLNENTFSSPPKNDLRKISVSPRVELMLNNDLFKKYLSRHGNLLEKLSQRQGRTRGTMKKAFSNLDLSKIDLEEELQPVTETQKSELNNSKSNIDETRVNNATKLNKNLHSQNPAIIRRRSMSLTGQSDPHYPELQEALRLNEPKQSGRSSRRSKFTLPSFEEFKRSRREKIAKGQAFVRDVMKNKENIPQSIISSLEDNEQHVFQKSDSECDVKTRIGKSVCNIEETVKDNQNTNGSISVPVSHSAAETSVNNSSQEKCSDKREVNQVNKTHRKPREKPVIKQCERRERLKLSESFCAKSPEQSTSSPRRSKSLKNKGKVKETLNTERQISENASDPLELSTDGQSIYATLKIFSDEFKIPSQGYQESSEDDICSNNDKNISSLPNMCQNCKGDIQNGHTVDTTTISQVNEGNYSGRSHSHTSASQRVILKASRKRKLPLKPQKCKSEDAPYEADKMHISKSCPRLSPPVADNTTLVNKRQSRPPHLELNRTHSCEVFGHELHSPLSPKSFSIENSPSFDKSATFNLPSSSSSNNGSETDIPIRGANEAVSAWNNSNSSHIDSKMVVSRSTSDITHNMTDGNRRRRDRKQRPYKSDPFNGSPPSGKVSQGPGQPRLHEYPDFVDEVSLVELDKEDGALFQVDPHSKIKHRLSNISDVSTDSGVIGPDSIPDAPPSPSSSIFSQTSLFGGQDSAVEISEGQTYTDADDKSNGDTECWTEKHAKERKETILEIRDTEINYGRDLRILKEEFYKPMKNNGLLTSEQLEDIFQNLEELIEVNRQFTERLQQAVDEAVDHGDEMLSSVVMGDLFLKSTNLIYTFEHYCINQSQATILLEQLEREKDILRIFLKVCQDEQPVLRRMHLKSFLMVPVQRIMKYPLLLERLHRATSPDHHDRDRILSAKTKIEKILEQINARTRMASQVKLSKRKISEKKMITVTEKIEVTRVAMEVLGWHRNDVCDILTSQLLVAPQQNDQNWATKRLRNFKFTNVHAVLLTLGQGELIHAEEECLLFPQRSQVIQAAVVLIKEKNGKFQTFREPFLLNRCIVNVDRDMEDVFELMELNKESCLFKSEDYNLYRLWLQNIKQQTLDLGSWRKRRNALPNIMIKHLV